MTANPVFGPCIKNIMFGTDCLTNQLDVLMSALKSHNITDPTEAMCVLQSYHERRAKRRALLDSDIVDHMLARAFTNLSSYGTNVSLGIFNDVQKHRREEVLTLGYGSSREYGNLPFVRLKKLNGFTLGTIRAACRTANFRPELYELDLNSQRKYAVMDDALSRLLLEDQQV